MKIAFIGLGIMGTPMAVNVAKKYDLIGYSRTKKDVPFPFASSYKECAEFADVVISMVSNNEAFEAVVSEMKPYLRSGTIWINMSTVYPAVSKKMAEELLPLGVRMCDAPVVKSKAAAETGDLGIYFGGDRDLFDTVLPILQCMGKDIIYMGGIGKGLEMKVLHNGLVGEIQNGVNEILGLAGRMGMDLNDVVTALGYGGAQCAYLKNKSGNVISGNYSPAFSVENMNKDAHFARDLAKEYGMKVPGLENVAAVYERAMEKGFAKDDFSRSYEAVNE